tara:strand:- start:634 stop:1332 length:699 start_codon:yes stop_codon:yes gene_type:complete
MATEFTYKSRKVYLSTANEASDLKDVTGSYIGPNEILLSAADDGTYQIAEIPATDADLANKTDMGLYGDADPTSHKWVVLSKDDADQIILMDMIMNCAGHTAEWQTEDVHTWTFDDDSTYVMQYRNPVNDNTRHTFDMDKTTVDQDTGKPNFVRFETWLENVEVQRSRAERQKLFYTEKMNMSISDTTKANWKKMVEVYEHIESNLVDTVPNHKIEFPMPGVVLQGKTYADG